MLLYGVGDIGYAISLLCEANAFIKAFLRHIDQTLCLLGNVTYREGVGAVANKTAEGGSHIDLDDIANEMNNIRSEFCKYLG